MQLRNRFLLALCVCLTAALFALQGEPQEGGHRGPGGHHGPPSIDERISHMSKDLNLTDDQTAKIKAILTDEKSQMDALHNDTATSKEDKMAKFKSIHEDSNSQVRALLTADQQKKFDEQEAKMKERMERHHREGGPGAPPDGQGPPPGEPR
jgi:protein CpxP